MKKIVATLATSVIIAGASLTTASAAEYKVEKGDSLWGIAKEFNTSVDELVETNDLKTTVIQPKQKLFINETYKVKKGDTLTGISEEYDVSVADLKEWNNLSSSLIVVGQELEINGVNVEQEDAPTATVSTESSANESGSANESSSANDSKSASETNSAKEVPATKNSSNATAQTTKQENANQNSPEGKTISVEATAYTANCAGCSGITSTGVDLNANPDAKVIAVDPSVIPLGTKVYVEGYGYATAADVGSAIQGHKIDVHVSTKDEAYEWGVRTVDVTIVKE